LVATNIAGTTLGTDQQFTTRASITIDGHTFTYLVTNGAVTITAYSGPGGNVTLPNTIAGLPVTAIGNGAFYSYAFNSTLTGVIFPNTVTSIGDAAFKGCEGLTNVIIPDSVTFLGNEAFCACQGLQSLTIGKGITTIRGGGDRNMFGTFQFCASLTRLTIPDNVTNITDGSLHLGGSLGAFPRASGRSDRRIPDAARSGCWTSGDLSRGSRNHTLGHRMDASTGVAVLAVPSDRGPSTFLGVGGRQGHLD